MEYELLLFLYVIHVHVAHAIDLCYVEINILLDEKKNGCETTSQALLGVHIIACNITNKINYDKNWV